MAGEKIKICYILPFYEEGTDTHLFYNYELLKKLASRDELDIFLIIEKPTKSDPSKLGFPFCVQKYSFAPFRFIELFARCLKTMKDGYHDFYVHYSYYGALAAFFAGGNVRYWNRGMPWLFERGWFEEHVFRFILKNMTLITGPASLAKEYQKHYAVREYRLLSNWVDVERFSPENAKLGYPGTQVNDSAKAQVLQDLAQRGGASRAIRQQANMHVLAKFDTETKIVLFVHHLSKRKGADLIPEIAKGFGGEVSFLVIGDGPERENLEECGLSNIKVLGKVPNAEIIKYFRVADIFLMPSREEGSPHVILEAMASGVPFVASDVGGVREVLPDSLTRQLCVSEDIECFRAEIQTLLSDRTLYNKAREECLSYAKNFSISRGVEEFIDLFQ